jgi:Protein of unknown function (DUF3052)
MPGYSGTPLPKKLGIEPGFRVLLLDLPEEVRSELKAAVEQCETTAPGKQPLDFAIVFSKSEVDLTRQFRRISKQLTREGMLWASWPKKTSGVATDLDGNIVREIGLAAGLVDVKVCAVTEIWSGLKFVRRLKDR